MRLKALIFSVIIVAALSAQTGSRSGIHPEDMDKTCQPCTDFYRFVNGGWLDKNPIPGHLSSWGTFAMLQDANRERIKTILEAARVSSAAAGSNERKMGDLYASCMDTAALDRRGLEPLAADFKRIDAIASVKDLLGVLAGFQLMATPSQSPNNGVVIGPFRLTSGIDSKNPTRVIARIVERDGAGGNNTSIFSLPDRDYYFKEDAKSRDTRDEFVKHVAKMLEIAGDAPDAAAAHAKLVLSFETSIAQSVLVNSERRDPDKTYNLMDAKALAQLAPNVDWAQFLKAVGIPETTPVNVAEPELLKKVNQQLTAVPLADWKVWLRWRVLKVSAPYLSKAVADEDFHFRQTVLNGVKEQQPRSETCGAVVDRDLSDALGEAFAAKYFPPEAKRRMAALVENLRLAMREEIANSEWMTPATRTAAILKLNALSVKIGYPDKWRDYSALKIDKGAYFENIRAAWEHNQRYQLLKIGRPVNHTDWNMTPPTVNAYSNSSQVEIVFPAGILQPPFFDLNADDAVNYGGIGAVIGHEMGHQFDDSGSKFDATGSLKNWWTPEDRQKFDARASCVVDQFNSIDAGDGMHHNGKLVLGEAMGDLGGMTVAYKAYHRSLAGKPGVDLDGYTADQRFFISFARIWGSQQRPEAMRLQVNTNPHPLAKWRAIATLQNMPEFQSAFQCKLGDAMVRPPAEQCKLW
jgi:putative endopeptidase